MKFVTQFRRWPTWPGQFPYPRSPYFLRILLRRKYGWEYSDKNTENFSVLLLEYGEFWLRRITPYSSNNTENSPYSLEYGEFPKFRNISVLSPYFLHIISIYQSDTENKEYGELLHILVQNMELISIFFSLGTIHTQQGLSITCRPDPRRRRTFF